MGYFCAFYATIAYLCTTFCIITNLRSMKNKRFLTIPQVADQLGVTSETVKNYIRKGVLRSRNIGDWVMVDRKSLEALYDDLSHLEKMKESLRHYAEELSSEVAEREKNLLEARKDNDLLAGIRHSQISSRLFQAMARAIGPSLISDGEMETLRMYLEQCGFSSYRVAKETGQSSESVRYTVKKAIDNIGYLEPYAEVMAENKRLRDENMMLTSMLETITSFKYWELKRMYEEGDLEFDDSGLDITQEEIKLCELLYTSIMDCDFSVRLINALKSHDISTLADIVNYEKHDLRRIRNLGRKSMMELEDFLEEKGLRLSMNVSSLLDRHARYVAKQKALKPRV